MAKGCTTGKGKITTANNLLALESLITSVVTGTQDTDPVEIIKNAILRSVETGNKAFLADVLQADMAKDILGDEQLSQELMDFIAQAESAVANGTHITSEDVEVVVRRPGERSKPITHETFNQDYVDALSTNTESDDVFKRDYRNSYVRGLPDPFTGEGEDAHLRNFLNLYFRGKTSFFSAFYEKLNATFREALIGTRMSPGQLIQHMQGPVEGLEGKFKDIMTAWETEGAGINIMKQSEIDKAFSNTSSEALELRNKYYAYIIHTNIDLVLQSMITGVSIQKSTDKKKVTVVDGVHIIKEFGTDKAYEEFINADLYDSAFDIVNDDPAMFADMLTSTDVVRTHDGNAHKVSKFFSLTGIEEPITSERFHEIVAGHMDLKIVEDGSYDRITNNDVFKFTPEGIVRVSPPHALSFNMADKHRKGPVDTFNGYDNDTAFIKFLVRSTPRLKSVSNVDGKTRLVQDTNTPYLTEAEYFTVSTTLSAIENRTREGIAEFILEQLAIGEFNNSSDKVVLRSIYYAYFHDGVYNYTPAGTTQEVKMASLNAVATSKKVSFDADNKNIADNMMSTMVSFFSKQSLGRVFYKNDRIVRLLSADTNPLENILPEEIKQYVLVEGKLEEKVERAVSFTLNSQGTGVAIYVNVPGGRVITVDIKYSEEGPKVTLSADSIAYLTSEEGANLSKLFRALNLPTRLINKKFTDRLALNEHATTEFTKHMIAYLAMNTDENQESMNINSSEAIKKLAKFYKSTSIHASLKVPIGEVAEIYSNLYGMLSSTYEINGEGNSTARITNKDREGRLKEILKNAKNKYAAFGIEHDDTSNNILEYSNVSHSGTNHNPIFGNITRRVNKDGIEKNMTFFSNNEMTLQHRMTHLIEGGFLSSLASTPKNAKQEILHQPMVYSDRNRINMYSVETKVDFKNLDTVNQLKENYINTYRGKYAAMQFGVITNWANFLLSPELHADLSPDQVVMARKAGLELSLLTAVDSRDSNIISKIAKKIHKIKIPFDIASKSKLVVRNTHVSNYDGYALPETTGGIMVDYLSNDETAKKFVDYNLLKFREVLSDPEMDYTKFTSDKARNDARDVFGPSVEFSEVLDAYHLVNAPLGDSILDTTMTPDVEFGKNELMSRLSLEGKPLTDVSFLEMLEERSQNFIKQSKRVQSQNSVGTQPETLRDAGYYTRKLPKNDLLVLKGKNFESLTTYDHKDKFAAGLALGLFSKFNGFALANGNVMITYGSNIVELSFNKGVFAVATPSATVYVKNSQAIDEIVESINRLGIKKLPSVASFVGDVTIQNVAGNVDAIKRKLTIDDGEIGFGLDHTSNGILMDEDLAHGFFNLLGVSGKKKSSQQDSFDGAQWGHPLYFLALSSSLGNEFNSFSTEGSAVKDLTQYRDPITGELIIQKKSTQNLFSNEILKRLGNEKMHNAFKVMNTAMTFGNGLSLQYRDSNDKLKAKVFDSIMDLEVFAQREVTRNRTIKRADRAAAVETMLNDMLPNREAYKSTTFNQGTTIRVPKVHPITGDILNNGDLTETRSFQNMQELWEYFGSYYNNNSWKNVAEILSNNPSIRNQYVQKLGFTSAQKSGVKGLNNVDLLQKGDVKSTAVVVTSVPNQDHTVMLQKLHSFESTEGAEHKAHLAVTSQFLSAMFFEGRTPTQALNATAGQAMVNNIRLTSFFRNIHTLINDEENSHLKEMEPSMSTGVKFSDLNPEDISINNIAEFEQLMELNGAEFKKKLFISLTTRWLNENIQLNRDSPAVIKMIKNLKGSEGKSFNAAMLRGKAVDTSRSLSYMDNVNLKLSGYSAVVSPADFLTTVFETAGGRLMRADAIDYVLSNGSEYERNTISYEEFLAKPGVIPTDNVLIEVPSGTKKVPAGQVHLYEDVKTVTYAILKPRSNEVTGWANGDSTIRRQDEFYEAQRILLSAETKEETYDRLGIHDGPDAYMLYDMYVEYRMNSKLAVGEDTDIGRRLVAEYVADVDFRDTFDNGTELSNHGTFDEFKVFIDEKAPDNSLGHRMLYLHEDGGNKLVSPVMSDTKVVVNTANALSIQNGNIPVVTTDGSVKSLLIMNAPLGQVLTAAQGDVTLIKQAAIELGYDSVNMLDEEGNVIQAYPISDDNIIDISSDEILDEFAAWKKAQYEQFKKNELVGIKSYHTMKSNPISDKDLLVGSDGEVVLAFYAKALFEADLGPSFTEYKIYTQADEDLNWYKYHVTNYKGKKVDLESTEVFQKYYTFNRDADVYEAVYGETVTKDNAKEIGERLRAEFRVFMEEENIETDPVEVFAPNSNLTAFMMTEEETLVSIAGYSNVDADQVAHAEKVFLQKLRRSKKINSPILRTPTTEAEYSDLLLKHRKKASKGKMDAANAAINNLIVFHLDTYEDSFKSMTGTQQVEFIVDLNKKTALETVAQEKIRARQMAEAFVRALYIMPPRIPGQGKQAGYAAKIKGFIHSNKNALYSPREAYFVTGKDNDIDVDNVLTYAIDKNGIVYDYKEYLDDEGAIMDADGTNAKFQAKMYKQAATMRAELAEAGYSEEAVGGIINNKLKSMTREFEHSVKNFIVDNMLEVMMSPANAIERETPVSMNTLKELANKLNDEVPKNLYNSNTHAINSYNSVWIPKLEHLNMQGKNAIAPYANGQRTLAAVIAVQFDQEETLEIGNGKTTFELSDIDANREHLAHVREDGSLPPGVGLAITVDGKKVIRDTFAGLEHMNKDKIDYLGKDQAWEVLSQLLSAATDNAKELLLGKIGANNDTNGLIANMLVMGFDFDTIHKFLTQGALVHIFDTIDKSRNEFNRKSLRSVVTNIIKGRDVSFKRAAYDIEAVRELNDIINASEGLDDFRRILTLAQNNRVDTYDLYKVLNPVYKHKGLTPTKLLSGESVLGDKAYNTGENSSPVNALYYIKNHMHARTLLASTNTAESIITSISDVDRILKDKMIKNSQESGYTLSRDAYDQTQDFINEAMIEEYVKGKKVFLPLADRTIKEYDLSSQDQRNDFIYDVAESVKYLKNISKEDNAFMDDLVLRESRFAPDKSIVNIPYLKEKNAIDRSVLDQALLTLDEVSDNELSVKLKSLKHSLFYYALLTSKGKSTRHTILSMFEEEYIEFAEAITDGQILKKGSMLHSLIMQDAGSEGDTRNALFLSLLTPASLPKVTIYAGNDYNIPEEFIQFAYDAQAQAAEMQEEQEIDEEAYMLNSRFFSEEVDPLMDTKIKTPKKQTLFTVKHKALADSIYAKATLSERYPDVAVRLTRRNTVESIAFNTAMPSSGSYSTLTGISDSLAQDIYRAGYNIGMEAIIKLDADSEKVTMGTVLSYLGTGMYLVVDENGTLTEMADVQLEELNKDKMFYGNNFGIAPTYKQTKRHSRSYKLAKERWVQVINKREVGRLGHVIYAKKLNSSGHVTDVTSAVTKDMIDYAFTYDAETGNTTRDPLSLSMNHIEFLMAASDKYNSVVNNQLALQPKSPQSISYFLKTRLTPDDSIISSSNIKFADGWKPGHNVVTLESLANSYAAEINVTGNKVMETDVLATMKLIVKSQSMESIFKAEKGADALKLIREQSSRLFPQGMVFNDKIIKYIDSKIDERIASCTKS